MAYGFRENGRLPNSEHESRPWRIREIVPDFILEDVWALPAQGGADEFPALIEMTLSFNPANADSSAARFLWNLRDRLGSWLGLGEIDVSASSGSPTVADNLPIPGTDETSLSERLPPDLHDTAAGVDFDAVPFVPLYRTDREAAAEISNRTVHGVAHFGWADRGDGRYQGQMAVYVKPRGSFGRAYMAMIKPFRYLIVYPALMRQFERAWKERPRGATT
jgi:hypothetical protein